MRKCQNCNIFVGGMTSSCPLCQSKLSGDSCENNWPEGNSLKKPAFFYRLQAFLVLAAIAICLLLDFRMGINTGKHYSPFVLLWGFALEFLVYDSIKKHVVVSKIITYTAVLLSVSLGITGWYFGFFDPILWVVIPSLIGASIIVNFIFSLVDRSGNAMVYFLVNIVLGIVPYIVLSVIGYPQMFIWTICLMLTIVTLLAILIFNGRKVLSELEKRMNF